MDAASKMGGRRLATARKSACGAEPPLVYIWIEWLGIHCCVDIARLDELEIVEEDVTGKLPLGRDDAGSAIQRRQKHGLWC
jgi:hypothetical protein